MKVPCYEPMIFQVRSYSYSAFRLVVITTLAMVAFAGNSLLSRMAFVETAIDGASFTTIRILSGALTLCLLVAVKQRRAALTRIVKGGSWLSGFALFAYAAGFSFAYFSLSTAMGALLLFGAVQVTMVSYGLWSGERLNRWQGLGFLLALTGLLGLLLPGLSAPPLMGSLLMLAAGFAWGVYSLRGKGSGDPLVTTAGNFLRALPMAVLLSLVFIQQQTLDIRGAWYAVASGALASGVGYSIWYQVLPALKATTASVVQLTVPVLAAVAGLLFLNEQVTLRLLMASAAILGGVALVSFYSSRSRT